MITAPRFVSQHQHRHQPPAAVARHDRRHRRQPDQPDGALGDRPARARGGGRRRVLRARRSENFARTGPTAPHGRSVSTRIPTIRTRADHPQRRQHRRHGRLRSAAYAFDTVHIGRHVELTGGLRWDRFDVDYESMAVAGVATPFERTDTMLSWRAGVGLQAATRRQHLRSATARRSIRRPKACRSRAATVALEPEKTRNFEARHEVGPVPAAAVGHGGALPHREDQRAHARRQPRRSADRARGRAARAAASSSAVGPDPTAGGRRSSATRFMRASIDASNTPAEVEQNLALTPEHTLRLWTTYELPRRRRDRRRRAVHGQRLPQRHQHRQRAELLADQRHWRRTRSTRT